MENKVTLQKNDLIISPTGFSKILSFKNSIVVPLKNVKGASVDRGIINEPKGFRELGTGLPDYLGGTFTHEGIKSFYNIKIGEIPVVIQLENEKYTRLILGVENPKKVVDDINNAIS